MSQKNKKFWGHWIHIWVYVRTSRMQIRKKWLNQLKNFYNKHLRILFGIFLLVNLNKLWKSLYPNGHTVRRHRDCQPRTNEHNNKQANMYPWQKGRDDIPSLLGGKRAVLNWCAWNLHLPIQLTDWLLVQAALLLIGLTKSLTKSSLNNRLL